MFREGMCGMIEIFVSLICRKWRPVLSVVCPVTAHGNVRKKVRGIERRKRLRQQQSASSTRMILRWMEGAGATLGLGARRRRGDEAAFRRSVVEVVAGETLRCIERVPEKVRIGEERIFDPLFLEVEDVL